MFNLNIYEKFMQLCGGNNSDINSVSDKLTAVIEANGRSFSTSSIKRAAQVLVDFKNNPIKELTFIIKDIEPVPAGRPRARCIFKNGKPMATVYPDPKDKNYRQQIMDIMQDEVDMINAKLKQSNLSDTESGLIEGEIHCRLIFNMSMPKANKFLHILGLLKLWRPLKKPDNDNLYKLFIDCQQGILFKDDSQFTTTLIEKYYAMEPSIQFKIWYREKPLYSIPVKVSQS